MADSTYIKELVACGEYLQAIGVGPSANRLEIDTTRARVSDEYPDLAGILSKVSESLTAPDKREIYNIALMFRDEVADAFTQRCGPEFLSSVVGCRSAVWAEVQALIHCDFEKGSIRMGPVGADSLAENGVDWVLEAVANRCLAVLETTANERRSGQAARDFMYVDCSACGGKRKVSCSSCHGTGSDPDPSQGAPAILVDDVSQTPTTNEGVCPSCGSSGTVPCDCTDTYSFRIPRQARTGSIVKGVGTRTGKPLYVVLDRRVVSPRPHQILVAFYRMQNVGVDCGLSEQEKRTQAAGRALPLVILSVALFVGWAAGAWLAGLAVGVMYCGVLIYRLQTSLTSGNMIAFQIIGYASLPLATGIIVGYFTTGWLRGLVVGSIMMVPLLGIIVGGVLLLRYTR